MLMHLPRIMVCAPRSGTGKTTLTCALLGALRRRGMAPLACKCGPDYVDPTFHAQVEGVRTVNLDLFFQSSQLARNLLAQAARGCDVAVVEGAMGYFDGIGVSADASAWDVARTTQTPALLVVDGSGASASIAAQVLGFTAMRNPSHIAGVVLNMTSPAMAGRLAPVVERECGVPVVGCLPKDAGFELPSRHLGLVPAGEIEDVLNRLERLADLAQEYLDMDAIVRIALDAPDLPCEDGSVQASLPNKRKVRLAVARDEAFCFYYAEQLTLLEDLGCELAFFSPLRDTSLPEGTCGLYLGGGYPELHARALSENTGMIESVRQALLAGIPTLAECGGFLYLHESLEDDRGISWPLVGAVPAEARRAPRHGRFGYVELESLRDGLLGPAGTKIRAHEFHRWDSSDSGSAFCARKPQSERQWPCGYHTPSLYAAFPHIYLPGCPQAARRFVDACTACGDRAKPANA